MELIKVNTNGIIQTVFVQGVTKPAKATLLMVHGGPGSTTVPVARKLYAYLQQNFTLVHWDQRGAGKSFRYHDTLSIERVTTDCLEIARYIKEHISPHVYLLGHSWGTYIALQAAHVKPDLFLGCVLTSQYTGQKEAQTVAIERLYAIAQAQQDSSLKMYLQSIAKLPMTSLSDIVRFSGILNAVGGTGRKFKISEYILGVLRSNEYSLKDKINFFRGQHMSLRILLPAMNAINRTTMPQIFSVPLLFIQGQYDLNCPLESAQQYFASITAPYKEFIVFNHSAHFPHFEERENFLQCLLAFVEQQNKGIREQATKL